MPVWKVLFIALFGCVCLALALATLIIPLEKVGGQRWLWLGGLFTATLAASTLFGLFLRHAGGAMLQKAR